MIEEEYSDVVNISFTDRQGRPCPGMFTRSAAGYRLEERSHRVHQNAEWAARKPPIAMLARNRSVAVVVGRSATATRAIPVTRARAAQFPHFLAALALGADTIAVTARTFDIAIVVA